MTKLEIALTFLQVFYEKWKPGELSKLLSRNLQFSGPFADYQSAPEYMTALIADPPAGMTYEITDIFENENAVCVIYQFSKGAIECPMCQIFEFDDENKICKIKLIFDATQF
ncbi:MAG: hypothetical protein D6748_06575 [Calditrichaeota bacterium]|nr:MAG: hypothetical protein D6748_06575 [Calditrichota bacterium]